MRNSACHFFAVMFSVAIVTSTMTTPLTPKADAQAKVGAGVLFLRIVNSARAVGMGGAVVNLADEEAPLYNSAAMGVYHLDQRVGFTIPIATDWLSQSTINDNNLSTFTLSGGYTVPLGAPEDADTPRLALALGYSRLKLDYGFGESWEKADQASIGVGFEYYARFGVGLTHKWIKSRLGPGGYATVATASANDYSAMLELPLIALLRQRTREAMLGDHSKTYEVTPSVALVKANNGDDINYPEVVFDDPLPKLSRTGVALKLGAKNGIATIGSLLLVHEWEKDLVSQSSTVKKMGAELGILGMLYLRLGKFSGPSEYIDEDTFGFGLRASGIILWLAQQGSIGHGNSLVRWVERGMDVVFDYGQYEGGNLPLSGTEFCRLRVSI